MSEKMILVLGGAASGKSAFAENIIQHSGLDKVYIATARVWDDEMKAKVAQHVTMRGGGWTTIDAPLEPAAALRALPAGSAVLIDCATMWLTNHVMDETDIDAAQAQFLDGLRTARNMRVVVSNELGGGLVPDTAMGRRFRQLQGELNQRLAAQADTVVLVTAGLPSVLKGTL